MTRELDIQVARILGLPITGVGGRLQDAPFNTYWTDDAADALGIPYAMTGRIPAYSTDPATMPILLAEIERRGLVERYQDALIKLLGLDMQVFNSAIELDWWIAPKVAGNTFEWEGHAYLWRLLCATPAQHARAFIVATQSP